MGVIRCGAAQDLIDAFVTETISAPDASSLADHVRTCPACAARLGSMTRLAELLGSLPAIEPSAGFEERQLAAALADRVRRHEHRSWLAELRIQVFRGAVRTTGTLAATIAVVALLGAAFVFAASNLVPGVVQQVLQGQATPHPSAPVTAVQPLTPAPTPTIQSVEVTLPPPTPKITPPAPVTPAPTPTPAPTATPEATPVVVVSPTLEPSPAASAAPTPTATPSPTLKPRRTPPPSTSPAPTDTASPSATPLPSP